MPNAEIESAINEFIKNTTEPFILKDLKKIGAKKEISPALSLLVKSGLLGKKKIGSANVYFALSDSKNGISLKKPRKKGKNDPIDQSEQLIKIESLMAENQELKEQVKNDGSKKSSKKREIELKSLLEQEIREKEEKESQIKELKIELKDFQKRERKSKVVDAIDSVDSEWEVVAKEIASFIAERQGITIDEVLSHFGAPIE